MELTLGPLGLTQGPLGLTLGRLGLTQGPLGSALPVGPLGSALPAGPLGLTLGQLGLTQHQVEGPLVRVGVGLIHWQGPKLAMILDFKLHVNGKSDR